VRTIVQDKFMIPSGPGLKEYRRESLVIHQRTRQTANRTLLIFAHGLNGDRYETWQRFPEFVFEDFPLIDIGLYGYSTGFSRIVSRRSIRLVDEARVLSHILREARLYEKFILVGHSMGGLLCKMVVADLLKSQNTKTLKQIKGLFLLATPQAGTLKMSLLPQWLGSDISALKPHGVIVQDVDRVFQNHLCLDESISRKDKISLPTWAIQGASDIWVDPLSSGLSLPENQIQLVHGSHTSIVKPAHKETDAYRFFRNRLAQMLGTTEVRRLPRVDPTANTWMRTARTILDLIEPQIRELSAKETMMLWNKGLVPYFQLDVWEKIQSEILSEDFEEDSSA